MVSEDFSHKPFSAGTIFERQELTSVDVCLIRTSKDTGRIQNIYNGRRAITYYIGIQIKQKDYDIHDDFKLKQPFGLHVSYKHNSAL